MSRVPVQIELPSVFMDPNTPDYVPPRSHDEAEIRRRQERPAGLLVLEQQAMGARATREFIHMLVRDGAQNDLESGSRLAAAALLDSARHSLVGGEPVLRRHFELPRVADPVTDMRISYQDRLAEMFSSLEDVDRLSFEIYERKLAKGNVPLKISHRLGHVAGTAAVWVALAPKANIDLNASASDIQHGVLKVGMDVFEETRNLQEDIGQNVSLAMIGGRSPRLETYMVEHMPQGAYKALHAAQDEAAKAF